MKLLSLICMLLSFHGFAQRPNVLYIMSDDHDAQAISAYDKSLLQTPSLDRIAQEGIRFTRCFVGNSICSPARATLLTGQHSHKNGVRDNYTRFDSSQLTMPKILQQAGYETAVIGKWHLHSYPAGFDYWKILPGQGLYFDPRFINMQGDTITLNGYATDVTTNEAITWLRQRNNSKPFVLLLHYKAPHRNFNPSLKFLEQYHKKTFPEPATLYTDTAGRGSAWHIQTMSILRNMKLCSDLKVDPAYLQGDADNQPDEGEIAYYHAMMNRIPEPDRSRIKTIYAERGKQLQQLRPRGNELLKLKYQWYMQDYLACVASIDENVGRLLNYLDGSGLTKNTAVIYTSDQGFYLGENGWFDKRFMYDVSMQTPLLMRWPQQIRPATTSTMLAQNIDFAPTILHITGTPIPAAMQGKSLVPVITGKKPDLKRPYLYYHYYEYPQDHTVLPHLGIRGDRYKLIYFYTVNEWELYDLHTDPREQKNLIRSAKHQSLVNRLKKELQKLRDEYDDHEPAGELN
ncbi:sulfatase family protein [Longitalea luteola]|uniref:sulfatase family protein n=1 Tax=Longitalea luteola TaxID=2812563 RepID=UPI001A9616E9|nr:sulfatase [Longitalea luteola]